ncbi:MAG: RHS repeat protein, partial [Verrucomicrobiae bacterium]|nr:RHS repeat protein [Verrucomicrobiae bacterium]
VLDDGRTQLYTYDRNDFSRVTQETDPLGRTFSYTYAPNNIDLLETRMTRNGASQVLSKATYNAQHRPLTLTDAAGQTTTWTYNAHGQPLTRTNAKGETTTYGYDAQGYLTSVDGPLPGAQDRETFTYDAVGRVRTRTTETGYTLTFAHDALDHLTQITFPDGTAERFGYTNLDLSLIVDRAGRMTRFDYNSVRQRVGQTDPLGRVTHFDWCKCGELSSVTDPLGRTTTWHHDVQARCTAKEYPDGSQVRYFYEATTSRLQRRVDENGQETRYTWNLDDTLARATYPNAAVPTPDVSFTYDPDYRRPLSMTDGTGTTSYGYHLVADPPVPGAGQLASVDGPLPADTITYTYDALGRRLGTAVNAAAASTFAYDAAGRLTGETSPLGTISYGYEGGTSRLASKTSPGGLTSVYHYAPLAGDEVLDRITHNNGATSVSEFLYTDDTSKNQIDSWSQQAGSQTPVLHRFTYDDAGQVTADAVTTGGAPTASYAYAYAYDDAGNRLREQSADATTTFTYNALNELTTRQPDARPAATYAWDAEQRLVSVTEGNRTTEFTYDGLGRRVTLRLLVDGVENVFRRFVWDDLTLREERDGSGVVTKRYYTDGFKIESGPSAGSYFYTRDHLGSVREVVDASGNIRARYAYDPFGRRTRVSGDLDSDFGFAGMFWSPEVALNLAPYRAYDPGAARWLSRDPLPDAEVDQGPNLYAYVRNNPVSLTDPLGLCCEDESKAVDAPQDAFNKAEQEYNQFEAREFYVNKKYNPYYLVMLEYLRQKKESAEHAFEEALKDLYRCQMKPCRSCPAD